MTDYVIMPKADYKSVCDLIRSRSGKTAPILSGQLKGEIEALLREAPGEQPGEAPGAETKKLSAPVIRLEEVGGEYDDSEYTPAILGVARLGQTKLGDIGNGLPKLTAPVIRIETATDGGEEPGEEINKLSAPEIRLETIADNEEPEENPSEVPKLDNPIISLETEKEPEEPAVLKLNTPKIELVGE